MVACAAVTIALLCENAGQAALLITLVVILTARLPTIGVLGSSFGVIHLLLLFVPTLPLFALTGRTSPRWSVPALLLPLRSGITRK